MNSGARFFVAAALLAITAIFLHVRSRNEILRCGSRFRVSRNIWESGAERTSLYRRMFWMSWGRETSCFASIRMIPAETRM